MEDIIAWVATVATIIAALMTASNLGPRITGYGFVVFTVGSLAWLALGIIDRPARARLDEHRSHRSEPLRHLALARPAGADRGGGDVSRGGERTGSGRNPVSRVAASQSTGRGSGRAGCSEPASTRWSAAAAAGFTTSSYRRAGSPASARRFGACLGTAQAPKTDRLVSTVDRFDGLTEIEKDQWPGR